MSDPTGFKLLAQALVELTLDTLEQIQVQENIGLGNVNNTSDASKPVSTAQAAYVTNAVNVAVAALTKASVGLANVDNTSDANKPVSTAQAAADALRVLKAGDTMTGLLVLSGAPTTGLHPATKTYVDTADALKAPINNAVFTGTTTLAADPAAALQAATKQYVDATVNALLDAANAEQFKGLIDCSANPNYPAANSGWVYKISVAGKIGGAAGQVVEIGDRLQCIVDGSVAGNDATVGPNWWLTQANVGFSSNGISLVTAATYAAMKTLLSIASADITDASANGRSLITAANYAAMKTLLAVAAADITDASANARSFITAANYAAMRVLLGLVIGTNVQAYSLGLDGWSVKTIPMGGVVGTTDAQTLANKTLTAPAITTPTGIVKGDVGLGNVDNTADANKPVSTAQAAADALRALLSGANFTGNVGTTGTLSSTNTPTTAAQIDTSGSAVVHVATGASSSACVPTGGGAFLIMVVEVTITGNSAIYLVGGGTIAALIGTAAGGIFVAPNLITPTPSAGQSTIGFDGTVYRVYHNQVQARDYRVSLHKF